MPRRKRKWRCIALWWMTLVLLTVQGSDLGRELSMDVVNAGRCIVRCLSLFQSRSSGEDEYDDTGQPVTWSGCEVDGSCSKCIKPCDQPSLNESRCDQLCFSQSGSDESGCRDSCRFLWQVNSIRPGTCPPETQATGTAALCIKGCDSDADCSSVGLKCCSNGCGWTCQVPSHAHDGMPDILEAPSVMETSPAGGVLVRWRPLFTNITGTLLYIVESQSNAGRQTFGETSKAAWQQIMRTTRPSALMQDIKPGHWYQYRVAAVNIYGSRGSSAPSLPFSLSKDPERPSPPINLTEGDSLIAEGRVTVSIHWSPPLVSDLPVSRYKIHWSQRLKSVSAQMQSLREYRQVVPADQLHFDVKDLEPDTTYFVQIQAISQHGEVRLKSEKASMYITTYPLPRSSDRVVATPRTVTLTVRPLPTPSMPEDLLAQKPYFQNGLLKANITWYFDEDSLSRDERVYKVLLYWSPEGCASVEVRQDESLPPVMSATTHENLFAIYDLRFGCRYLIRVQGVTDKGVSGPMAFTFLDTPFCNVVPVIGEVMPDCPRNSPRVPSEPTDLNHRFIIGSSSITAKLNWSPPSSMDVPVTGYIVVWSQVHSDGQFLLVDKATMVSRLVNKDVQTLVMGNFAEATTYSVRIQANSKHGWGRVASIRFLTPNLQPPAVDPLYKDISIPGGRVDSIRPNTVKKKIDLLPFSTDFFAEFPTTKPVEYDSAAVFSVQRIRYPTSLGITPPSSSASTVLSDGPIHNSCLFLTVLLRCFLVFWSVLPCSSLLW